MDDGGFHERLSWRHDSSLIFVLSSAIHFHGYGDSNWTNDPIFYEDPAPLFDEGSLIWNGLPSYLAIYLIVISIIYWLVKIVMGLCREINAKQQTITPRSGKYEAISQTDRTREALSTYYASMRESATTHGETIVAVYKVKGHELFGATAA